MSNIFLPYCVTQSQLIKSPDKPMIYLCLTSTLKRGNEMGKISSKKKGRALPPHLTIAFTLMS